MEIKNNLEVIDKESLNLFNLLPQGKTCWLNSSHIMKGVKLLRPLMTQK